MENFTLVKGKNKDTIAKKDTESSKGDPFELD